VGVQEAVAKVREGLAELCDASLWALSDAESRDHLVRLAAIRNTVDAVYLMAVRDLDSRPDAVAGARPGRVAKTFLEERLRRSHAAADVAAAHALADDLSMLGDALAAGEVSREHVDGAVRTLKRIPDHFRETPEQRVKVDAWFTEAAQELPPLQTDKAARHLLAVLDPDAIDRFDPHAIDRRDLSVVTDSTGMVVIRGQLDPGTGAPLLAVLDHLSKPAPAKNDDHDEDEGPEVLPIPDTRTRGQRNADALGLMARLALGAVGTGGEVDRPRVVIHAPRYGPVAESDQTGPVSEPWLARFLCDAVLEAVLVGRQGEVLNLGRRQRTVSTHQRRAVIARDGGCVIPNCHAPGAWCDAHHATWWSKGGATDVDNLAMLCPRHHADVHAGIWSVQMIDGLPWARPPTWADPQRRWRRNTYRHHRDQAHQLRLDLEPPGSDAA
jgi:hypothetical protein